MGLFIGDNAPSKIFIGDSEVSKVFVGDTQVRPSGWQPGANTKVYYNINDNDTNTTIYDLSGNGVDQTWGGTPGYTTDATYGRVATFNGSSYTEAGSRVNFGNEITFIALVKHSATGQQTIIAECASSSTWNIGLNVDDNFKPNGWFSGSGNGDLRVADNDSATVGNWYMVAATRDINGVAKIYINGILKNTVTLNGTPTYTNGANLQIGRWRSGGPTYLNGQFKLFIGEDRTRTAQEIADLASEYGF